MLLLTAAGGGAAWAGGRARMGGTLSVAAVSRSATPTSPETPVEAALFALSHTPLCRLAVPSRPTPTTVVLSTSAPAEVAAALEAVRTGTSPYRALLSAVKRVTPAAGRVELTLDGPAPELEAVLCHPALSVSVAPFVEGRANVQHPAGRPFVDGVTVQLTVASAADRLVSQRRAHVVLGVGGNDGGPLAFATYLRVAPDAPAGLRTALEASIDRAELTRFFVRAPAQPLHGVLPPSLGGPATAQARPPRPPRPPAEVTVTLAFDDTNDDHRAIAQKLQVKLQPLGFRVSLVPVARGARASSALSLQTLVLPPAPGPALDLIRAVAGDADGQSLLPLCLQGLALTAAPDVRRLTRDDYGI
ncbi:MAG: hypothetical protein JNG84_00020, partial [Archangium sp.]|nr:hypothetical protein [Archangium sp.]